MTTASFASDLRNLARVLPHGTVGPRTLPLFRLLDKPMRARKVAGVRVETHGNLSFRIHAPSDASGAPWPALLWIHGGGYVMGTAAQDDAICGEVAHALGVLVAAVDYRLAPEHPFPTPLHDCHDALVWLAAREDVDAQRVAIGGASAGGGLAAALALLARDRAEVQPVFQLLSYPMLDDRTAARADVDDRNARLWNNRCNRFGWRSYLGAEPGSDAVSPLAAVARHDDLGGVAPAWIGVGTLDIFHDEDRAYAERLTAAGVRSEFVAVEGAFHGFDSVSPRSGTTRGFRDAQLAALSGALA